MAHLNIEKRRDAVRRTLGHAKSLSTEARKKLAMQFQCSKSAIYADIMAITRSAGLSTAYVNPRKRAIVHWRDAGVCQYCMTRHIDGKFIIEHIIPASFDGVAEFHNLTLACQSCNVAKSNKVWIPNNLFAIAVEHPSFCDRVLQLMVRNPTQISLNPDDHFQLKLEVQVRMRLAVERWNTDQPKTCKERILSTAAFVQTFIDGREQERSD